MKRLHLFNPENDIALAHGGEYYTPPPVVRSLRDAGAALPLWYADEGDFVYAPDVDEGWESAVCNLMAIESRIIRHCVDSPLTGMPWGWSLDARRRLVAAGSQVPDREWVERLRMLSHRSISCRIMARLAAELPFEIPEIPVEAHSVDEVIAYLSVHRDCYIKAPWSSTGRGVFRAGDDALHRVAGILRRQQSVMLEPTLDNVQDFAMLFNMQDGKAVMIGYSVFFNSHLNAYGGNYMAPNCRLEQMLVEKGASLSHLRAISTALERALSAEIGADYNGYLGVDMLITGSGMIAPCVEVNLRMTMGIVSHIFAKRYLAHGVEALYTVGPAVASSQSPVVSDHRLVAGTLYLTPTLPGNQFCFAVTVL